MGKYIYNVNRQFVYNYFYSSGENISFFLYSFVNSFRLRIHTILFRIFTYSINFLSHFRVNRRYFYRNDNFYVILDSSSLVIMDCNRDSKYFASFRLGHCRTHSWANLSSSPIILGLSFPIPNFTKSWPVMAKSDI